jgi:hypothetical protein
VLSKNITLVGRLDFKIWRDSVSLAPKEFTDFSPDVHLNFLFDEFTFREERIPGSLRLTILAASGSVGLSGGLLLLLRGDRWFLWLLLLLLLCLVGSLIWGLLRRRRLCLLLLRLLGRSRLVIPLLVRLDILLAPLVGRLDNILPGRWHLLLYPCGHTTSGGLLLEKA